MVSLTCSLIKNFSLTMTTLQELVNLALASEFGA
jgi:hypothetical protein